MSSARMDGEAARASALLARLEQATLGQALRGAAVRFAAKPCASGVCTTCIVLLA